MDDYWNVDGDRVLSEAWTTFTQFTILTEKPPDGHTWSWAAIDKKASNIEARSFVARNMVNDVCQKQLNDEESKNGRVENRSSTMQEG